MINPKIKKCIRNAILCWLFLLAGCAPTPERVELGNQSYDETPIRIYLVPMEGVSATYASAVVQEIQRRHGLRVRAITTMGRDDSMFNKERRQYNANAIAKKAFEVVGALGSQTEKPFILVLTPYDINAEAFDLRYLFAAHFEGLSVVSTARIDPVNYGLPRNDAVRDQRLIKLINKAIGQQVLRYPISSNRASVMYGPIMGVEDLDSIGDWYVQ